MSALTELICGQTGRVVEIQRALTAIPAVGPENGGQGEMARAQLIEKWLAEAGIDRILRFDSPDKRVECGIRPNIVAVLPGSSSRVLWLFGHMDVVPPGDMSQWISDPWTVRREGDLLFGRGVEDNQQAISSMLILAESLRKLRITPRLALGLVFMADEERGSRHGLAHILESPDCPFGKDDLYIVPDGGAPDGLDIEIAEKAQLWAKFTVIGRQCHASTPEKGKNAFLGASELALAISGLGAFFPQTDALFTPPVSTFTPTKHEANVESVNILPGKDVFYADCRILPEVDTSAVLDLLGRLCQEISAKRDLTISMEVEQLAPASATPADAPVVKALSAAIEKNYGAKARTTGIGGATVAAFLRARDFPAAVWACLKNTCHQPNEHASIKAACKDSAIFADILMEDFDG